MTRPKVDPEKRQRIAQACDSCKRRKQKCNGVQPCNACAKRNATCTYSTSATESDGQPAPKRQMINQPGSPPPSSINVPGKADTELKHPQHIAQGPQLMPKPSIPDTRQLQDVSGPTQQGSAPPLSSVFGHTQGVPDNKRPRAAVPEPETHLQERGTSFGGKTEEAIVESSPRLLEDSTGRILYIGDSATLSFLQLIRTYVESIAGSHNAFVMDPKRLKIVESTVTVPHDIRRTHLLPDWQTATVLVNSFFTNTNGLVEVFPRKTFLENLDKCYSDPLSVHPSWLCLLYLTFAIGLAMAAPKAGTPEEKIIQKLRDEVSIGKDGKSYPVDRAEIFYLDARHLSDPSGFEDAGFWSIQALTLMSVYLLAVSKRNAAYAFAGMALRSAFSLGLHRAETMAIFSSPEQLVRRNLWRSLYVLDRFLSASLGRPTVIRDKDCSGDILISRSTPPAHQSPLATVDNSSFIDGLGLEAAVSSCYTIGVILDKVYSQRKVSGKLAQEIADHCKGWPQALDPSLHYSQANPEYPAQCIAILHIYLLHCHSIILLTRPFFLFIMNKEDQKRRETRQSPDRGSTRADRFGEACVSASCKSIALVHNAIKGGYLPRKNPFVIYFLFTAALVTLSSQFSDLYPHITADSSASSSVNSAIDSMQYCAKHDLQATRLHFILTSFRDVVIQQRASMAQSRGTNIQQATQPQPMTLSNQRNEPMGINFLTSANLQNMTALQPGMPMLQPQRALTEQSISPRQQVASITPISPTNINIEAAGYGHGQKDVPSGLPTPQSSWDPFLELAHIPSDKTSDGGESLIGDAEIDFDTLLQWPHPNGSGIMPGGAHMTLGGAVPGGGVDMRTWQRPPDERPGYG